MRDLDLLRYGNVCAEMMFLKVYGTESVLAGKIGVDEDTYRDHMWPVVRAIASLKLQVVRYYILFIHHVE